MIHKHALRSLFSDLSLSPDEIDEIDEKIRTSQHNAKQYFQLNRGGFRVFVIKNKSFYGQGGCHRLVYTIDSSTHKAVVLWQGVLSKNEHSVRHYESMIKENFIQLLAQIEEWNDIEEMDPDNGYNSDTETLALSLQTSRESELDYEILERSYSDLDTDFEENAADLIYSAFCEDYARVLVRGNLTYLALKNLDKSEILLAKGWPAAIEHHLSDVLGDDLLYSYFSLALCREITEKIMHNENMWAQIYERGDRHHVMKIVSQLLSANDSLATILLTKLIEFTPMMSEHIDDYSSHVIHNLLMNANLNDGLVLNILDKAQNKVNFLSQLIKFGNVDWQRIYPARLSDDVWQRACKDSGIRSGWLFTQLASRQGVAVHQTDSRPVADKQVIKVSPKSFNQHMSMLRNRKMYVTAKHDRGDAWHLFYYSKTHGNNDIIEVPKADVQLHLQGKFLSIYSVLTGMKLASSASELRNVVNNHAKILIKDMSSDLVQQSIKAIASESDEHGFVCMRFILDNCMNQTAVRPMLDLMMSKLLSDCPQHESWHSIYPGPRSIQWPSIVKNAGVKEGYVYRVVAAPLQVQEVQSDLRESTQAEHTTAYNPTLFSQAQRVAEYSPVESQTSSMSAHVS